MVTLEETNLIYVKLRSNLKLITLLFLRAHSQVEFGFVLSLHTFYFRCLFSVVLFTLSNERYRQKSTEIIANDGCKWALIDSKCVKFPSLYLLDSLRLYSELN